MIYPVTRSLVFGLICALVGLGFGIVISLGFSHPSYDYFWIPVVLSSFTFGALFWRLLPERYTHRRILWGVLAGVLGSLVAHFTTWLLTYLGDYLRNWLYPPGSTGQPLMNIADGLMATFLMGFMSILVLGWLTSIIGGILGGTYAFFLRKRGLLA